MAVITIKVAGKAGCQADVYVARYEVYPNVDPTGVCVGFQNCLQPEQNIRILGHCCPQHRYTRR